MTNDRFDPLRPGAEAMAEALAEASARPAARRPRRAGLGRRSGAPPRPPRGTMVARRPPRRDGPRGGPAGLGRRPARSLRRPARETAALDPWAPPWRDLAPGWPGPSSAASSAGATSSRASRASSTPPPRPPRNWPGWPPSRGREREPVLSRPLDPANLYGSGAPLDIPLLEGGTARLPRSPANYLVLSAAGRC